jgi:hypothetical protein
MAVAVGARPVGIESVLGEASGLGAAGAAEVAPSVAAWVDDHLAGRSAGADDGARASSPGADG